jgi:hypothetical protein
MLKIGIDGNDSLETMPDSEFEAGLQSLSFASIIFERDYMPIPFSDQFCAVVGGTIIDDQYLFHREESRQPFGQLSYILRGIERGNDD